MIDKKELDAFCARLVALEDEKKEIAEEIKESISAFAESQGFTKKSIHKFIKEWKEANKDKDEYVLTDYEADKLMLIAFPELDSQTTAAPEA